MDTVSHDTRQPQNAVKRPWASEAERREWLAQFVLRRTQLDEGEVVLLRVHVFPGIFGSYHDMIWKQIARRVVDDGARDDITQNTFIGLYFHICKHGFPLNIPGMLRVHALHNVLNHLRRKRRAPMSVPLPSSGSEKPRSEQPDLDFAVDCRQIVPIVLEALSDRHWEVLEAVTFSEMSYEEAALALEIPEDTLKSRLMAAKEEFLSLAEQFRSKGKKVSE